MTQLETLVAANACHGVSPLFRVFTFGRFVLERLERGLDGEEPVYVPLGEREWKGRSSARSLLKLLLCRPRRRAPRDFLAESLWPDSEHNALHCLDNAVSALRVILRSSREGTPGLLSSITQGSTLLYELAAQELLWTDFDACLALLTEAERLRSQGDDPLPLLEQAQQLVQGEFLEEEIYSNWATARRETVNATRRQLAHRLVGLYQQRQCSGQAELLLFAALEHEPADEDALAHLMLLLARQGRRYEALRLYQKTVDLLCEEYSVELAPSIKQLAEHIRSDTFLLDASPRHATQNHPGVPIAHPLSAVPLSREDDPAMKPLVAQTWHAYGPMLSRREALAALSGLPASLIFLHDSSSGEFLRNCAVLINTCWQALAGSGLATIESSLNWLLYGLRSLAEQPSFQQREAARLLSYSHQLAGVVALHKNDMFSREQHNRAAMLYAQLAEDHESELVARLRLTCTYHLTQQPRKALQLYQEALPQIAASPCIFAPRFYAGLASVYAQIGERKEAERYLDLAWTAVQEQANETHAGLLTADCGLPLTKLYIGLAYRHLGQFEQAWDAHAVDQLPSTVVLPERIRLELLNHQAHTALLLSDRDRFCELLQRAICGALHIGSQRRRLEAIELYHAAQLLWPHEAQVRQLNQYVL